MSRQRITPNPPRTIPIELLNIWQANKRKLDAPNIVQLAIQRNKELGKKVYPVSKPTIDKALLYGHVLEPKLTDLINEYFENREKQGEEKFKQFKNKGR